MKNLLLHPTNAFQITPLSFNLQADEQVLPEDWMLNLAQHIIHQAYFSEYEFLKLINNDETLEQTIYNAFINTQWPEIGVQQLLDYWQTHFGDESTYEKKDDIINGLQQAYFILATQTNIDEIQQVINEQQQPSNLLPFTDEDTLPLYKQLNNAKQLLTAQQLLSKRLLEDVDRCTPGYDNRVKLANKYCYEPATINQFLQKYRDNIIEAIVALIINIVGGDESIHIMNALIYNAVLLELGVTPLVENDPFRNIIISDDEAQHYLESHFGRYYTPTNNLLFIRSQLEQQLQQRYQYIGYIDAGYENSSVQGFIETIQSLFEDDNILWTEYLITDESATIVHDINWSRVMLDVSNKLTENDSFLLSKGQLKWLQGYFSGTLLKPSECDGINPVQLALVLPPLHDYLQRISSLSSAERCLHIPTLVCYDDISDDDSDLILSVVSSLPVESLVTLFKQLHQASLDIAQDNAISETYLLLKIQLLTAFCLAEVDITEDAVKNLFNCTDNFGRNILLSIVSIISSSEAGANLPELKYLLGSLFQLLGRLKDNEIISSDVFESILLSTDADDMNLLMLSLADESTYEQVYSWLDRIHVSSTVIQSLLFQSNINDEHVLHLAAANSSDKTLAKLLRLFEQLPRELHRSYLLKLTTDNKNILHYAFDNINHRSVIELVIEHLSQALRLHELLSYLLYQEDDGLECALSYGLLTEPHVVASIVKNISVVLSVENYNQLFKFFIENIQRDCAPEYIDALHQLLLLIHKFSYIEQQAIYAIEPNNQSSPKVVMDSIISRHTGHLSERRLKSFGKELYLAQLSFYIAQLEHKSREFAQSVNPGLQNAAQSASNLANNLNDALIHYTRSRQNARDCDSLCRRCLSDINDVRPVLEQHRGYKQIIVNTLVVLSGIGLLFLIARAAKNYIQGRSSDFFISSDTASKKILDEMQKMLSDNDTIHPTASRQLIF